VEKGRSVGTYSRGMGNTKKQRK